MFSIFLDVTFFDQIKKKKKLFCEQMQDINMHVCMYMYMYNVPIWVLKSTPFLPLVIHHRCYISQKSSWSFAQALASLKFLAFPTSSERLSTITSNMVTLVWVTVGLNEAKVGGGSITNMWKVYLGYMGILHLIILITQLHHGFWDPIHHINIIYIGGFHQSFGG